MAFTLASACAVTGLVYVQAPSAGSVHSITRFFDRTERRMIVPLSLRSFINHKRLFGIDSGVGMKGRGRYLPRSLPKAPKGLRRSGDFRRPLSALGLTLLSLSLSISYKNKERRMPKGLSRCRKVPFGKCRQDAKKPGGGEPAG